MQVNGMHTKRTLYFSTKDIGLSRVVKNVRCKLDNSKQSFVRSISGGSKDIGCFLIGGSRNHAQKAHHKLEGCSANEPTSTNHCV